MYQVPSPPLKCPRSCRTCTLIGPRAASHVSKTTLDRVAGAGAEIWPFFGEQLDTSTFSPLIKETASCSNFNLVSSPFLNPHLPPSRYQSEPVKQDLFHLANQIEFLFSFPFFYHLILPYSTRFVFCHRPSREHHTPWPDNVQAWPLAFWPSSSSCWRPSPSSRPPRRSRRRTWARLSALYDLP